MLFGQKITCMQKSLLGFLMECNPDVLWTFHQSCFEILRLRKKAGLFHRLVKKKEKIKLSHSSRHFICVRIIKITQPEDFRRQKNSLKIKKNLKNIYTIML